MTAVDGYWASGQHEGLRGQAVGVYAGRLVVQLEDGSFVTELPHHFCSDAGEAEDEVLAILLPAPPKSRLFRGAVRESLAASHSTAMSGCCETRSWDSLDQYVVDDEQGSRGVLWLTEGWALGALCNSDPWKEFDAAEAASNAPTPFDRMLAEICSLPLLDSPTSLAVSAIFWSGDTVLESTEPWHTVYIFGGELLDRELMDDREWVEVAAQHYDIGVPVARAIVGIAARRRRSTQPLSLTEDELELLIPRDAKRRDDGLERLLSGGACVLLGNNK